MLQTLPALFISSLLGLMLTCPVNMCAVKSSNSWFQRNMFGVCPETKRCAGMGDRESINPKEGTPKARARPWPCCWGGGGGKKIHINFFICHSAVLTFSCLQENRVGHDIFNLHCQNANPEQSRYISLSGKRRIFLIKRADDGEAAARARGERGTGA